MVPSIDDKDFDLMLTETVSGSVFLIAIALAWRDIPEAKRSATTPLKTWEGMTHNGREMYVASAKRFRDALLDVEDDMDPLPEEVPAL